MKRIFLTSGLVICMACPAFATVDLDTSGNATGYENECVEPVLGVYEAPVDSPVQLEAKWNANQYTIAFAKGQAGNHTDTSYITGTTSSITPVTFESTDITLANGFSATGYHFTGWSSPVNLATGVTGTTPYNGTAGTHNANYTSPVLASYGYDAPVADNRTVTLTAQWAANTYNVIYHAADQIVCDANSACTSGAYTDTNGATYDAQYSALNLAGAHMHENTGYTFLGWTTDSTPTITRTGATAGTLQNEYTGDATWTRTSNLDVYAAYLANQYTITYAHGTAGSRTEGFSGSMSDQTVTYNADTTLTANAFSIPGYTFAGWSVTNPGADEPTSYANSYNWANYDMTHGLALVATWSAKTTTVSYNCGASNADPAVSGTWTAPTGWSGNSQTATYDDNFSHPTGATVCSLSGYTFDHWNCVSGTTGSTTNGIANDGITGGKWTYDAENVTCTAVWDNNTIHVNWYADSGNTAMEVGTESQSCEYDSTLTVPTAPTKNGYQFNGWTVRSTSPASNN